MKKWIAVALIVCVASFVQAAEGKKKGGKGKGAGKPMNKEQFVAAAEKRMKAAGKEFDKAKVEKMFDKLDTDGDGTVTPEERKAGQKGKKGGKKK